ncbi:hypothetical protein [Streptomyces sp. NPDC056672]|uniref:hypothetical protein n=1 Tax=Streptomyces sp. NPDC056672 TaxID=3345906 RepID=UPI0036A3781C
MTNTASPVRAPRPVPYMMDEEQAQLLTRLSEDYADALPGIQARTPQASVAALLHAVIAHQVRRLVQGHRFRKKTTGPGGEAPEDRAEDVAAALALVQVARADLDGLEAALLLTARHPSTRTGRPLLTFRKIAAALGVESDEAARGHYRLKVGTLNASSSGIDGTP